MRETYSQLGTRANWQSHEGFLYVGDVALKMMGDLATATPDIMEEYRDITPTGAFYELSREYPGVTSLFLAASSISSHIPSFSDGRIADRQHFGITKKDWQGAEWHDTFAHGVGELDFTWHFAPGVASSVAHSFVREGALGKEDLANFTLTDWANVIGTGWFSKLMHSMAYAPNGMYRQYGRYARDYLPEGFRRYLVEESDLKQDELPAANNFFQITEKFEPDEDMVYTTASLSKDMMKYLRKSMEVRPNHTGGCPVARYGTTMLRAAAAKNNHVQRMISREQLHATDSRSHDDMVRLRMDWSPIDVTLAVLAQNLEAYDAAYGTPVLNFAEIETGELAGESSHRRMRPVDALRRPAA